MKVLYSEERRNAIVKLLKENSRVSVGELSTHFDVSEATIRSDLRFLEEQKMLQRTRGGAIIPDETDLSFSSRAIQHIREKQLIAREAFKSIREHDSIVLDASSTCLELANLLRRSNLTLTVVTNGLHAAQSLVENPKINTILIGGVLRNQNSVEGTFGLDLLNHVYVEKFFFSARAVSPNGQLMDFDLLEVELKRALFLKSIERYCLLDSSKWNKYSVSPFGSLEETDVLFSDSLISNEYADKFSNLEIVIPSQREGNE